MCVGGSLTTEGLSQQLSGYPAHSSRHLKNPENAGGLPRPRLPGLPVLQPLSHSSSPQSVIIPVLQERKLSYEK